MIEFWTRWMSDASVQLAVLVVLIGVITLLGHRLSARLRYALWLLVLLKALLPPFWAAPWSVVNQVTEPLQRILVQKHQSRAHSEAEHKHQSRAHSEAEHTYQSRDYMEAEEPLPYGCGSDMRSSDIRSDIDNRIVLFALWFGGAILFWGVVLYNYGRAMGILEKGNYLESGPIAELLQKLKLRLNIKAAPQIILSDSVSSPFLYGLFVPKIAIPADFPGEVGPDEMESVLLHELTHWKRGDLFVARLELLVQGLFWFHPLVWLAIWQLRRERESACDESVLDTGCVVADRYGNSLLNVLDTVRDRLPVPIGFLGFLGILERKTQLQQRLEEIMFQQNHVKKIGTFGWGFLLFLFLCVLPMAVAQNETEKPKAAETVTPPIQAPKEPEKSNENSSEPSEPPKTEIEYRGRIVDESGKPVADASIHTDEIKFDENELKKFSTKPNSSDEDYLNHFPSQRYGKSYQSDKDGYFKFNATYTDAVFIRISFPSHNDRQLADRMLRLPKAGDVGDIVLAKGISPTVRVLTPDDKPLSDVWVNLFRKDVPYSFYLAQSELSYGGKSTFRPVEPGEYKISVTKRRLGTANDDARLVPFVFREKQITITPDNSKFDYQAVETVTVNVRFKDGVSRTSETHPRHYAGEITFQTPRNRQEGVSNNPAAWQCFWHDGDSMGNGVYRFRVPKGMELDFCPPKEDLPLSVQFPKESILRPILTSHPALEGFGVKIPALKDDIEIIVQNRRSPVVTLHANDESGNPIQDFWAWGLYLENVLPDGTKQPKNNVVSKISVADFLKFYPTQWSFDHSFKASGGDGDFSWDKAKNLKQVSRIQPDIPIRLFLFDKEGRQGFVDGTFKEGEEKELTVELTLPTAVAQNKTEKPNATETSYATPGGQGVSGFHSSGNVSGKR